MRVLAVTPFPDTSSEPHPAKSYNQGMIMSTQVSFSVVAVSHYTLQYLYLRFEFFVFKFIMWMDSLS